LERDTRKRMPSFGFPHTTVSPALRTNRSLTSRELGSIRV
jgi:hypothetical protein